MPMGFPLGGGNYTGMLTRSIVFSGALIVFLASMFGHTPKALELRSHSDRVDTSKYHRARMGFITEHYGRKSLQFEVLRLNITGSWFQVTGYIWLASKMLQHRQPVVDLSSMCPIPQRLRVSRRTEILLQHVEIGRVPDVFCRRH